MDNPKSTNRLQRRSSLPPRIQRHASLRQRLQRRSTLTRRPTDLRHHSPNKSNPYVGWFRHAPDTSVLEKYRLSGKRARLCPSSQSLNMRNSPYIGWFRHAPPTSLHLPQEQWKSLEHEFATLLEKMAKKNLGQKSMSGPFVCGHLKGGAPEPHSFRRIDRSMNCSIPRGLQTSSDGSPSATLNVLTRLASWFLYPLAHDADSCGYRHSHDEKIAVGNMFPHLFPSVIRSALLEDDSSCSCHDNDDDDSTVGTIPNDFPNELRDDFDISVSSLAEAYYAHQAEKEIDQSVYAGEGEDRQRLDYVITQMDIARMARNASRHLDVASILSLPTITYQSKTESVTPPPSAADDPGWSWMIVHDGPNQQSAPKEEETEVCVICLEHFEDGDRLRVLPCDHSFHVGCIDRWLSGSHSFEDCYTSGCPTCKKRPEPPSDGSVPAWAFTRIGESLRKNSISSAD